MFLQSQGWGLFDLCQPTTFVFTTTEKKCLVPLHTKHVLSFCWSSISGRCNGRTKIYSACRVQIHLYARCLFVIIYFFHFWFWSRKLDEQELYDIVYTIHIIIALCIENSTEEIGSRNLVNKKRWFKPLFPLFIDIYIQCCTVLYSSPWCTSHIIVLFNNHK